MRRFDLKENLMKQNRKRVPRLRTLVLGTITFALAGLAIVRAAESDHIIRAALDDDAIQHIRTK
jgi:hypothetical protein